ncbi:type II toxin-antitoxin system HicB family antitoxin [Synechococcus sp. CBW1107]|uniref:type II toxin-antitoxin system HicB family antitoxin n=1 Tax=Synechococcus sp. CBW1107 TaxID=2789857 RepID=UPI002AD4933B|nr:type II toxin-antitoxin system HicB family antitoxin [Synechococcus sp. CBW1107]
MSVDGYYARIEYNSDTDLFRGEILGLSGGADFYGANPDELRQEFKKSLDVFLEVCKEQGIEPRRQFSGKFNLRIPPELHEQLAMAAEAQGKSLNALAQETLQKSVTA